MSMERCCNDTNSENLNEWGKTCLNATLSNTNYTLKQRQKQETKTRNLKT